jgi:hypothetical protein
MGLARRPIIEAADAGAALADADQLEVFVSGDSGDQPREVTLAEIQDYILEAADLSAVELGYLDEVEAGTVTASKAVVVGASKDIDTLQIVGDGDANTAILLGGGTGGAPATTDTANLNFVEFRGSSTATTAGSDTRCAYLRLYLDGATTGGGDAVRAFATVNAAVGTAHGAHISASFGASGAVSGQAVAMRSTLHIPDKAVTTGTQAACQGEIFADGDSSDISGISHGLFRGVVGGDSTGAATVSTFLLLSAPAPASNAFIDTDEGAGTAYAGLKVVIEGVGTKYIPLLDPA